MLFKRARDEGMTRDKNIFDLLANHKVAVRKLGGAQRDINAMHTYVCKGEKMRNLSADVAFVSDLAPTPTQPYEVLFMQSR